MKRSFLFSLILGGLFLSACKQTGVPIADGGTSYSSVAFVSSATASGASSVQAQARIVRIEATNWAFAPSTITAMVGEKVSLEIVGVSGNHGIGIPDLGLDVKVDAGQTISVDLPTDKAGTFSFRCSVLCGEGHRDMTGTITISE